MKNNIYLENFIYKRTTEHFSDVIAGIERTFFMTLTQRIAAFLLDEAADTGSDELALTQEAIARSIDAIDETVIDSLYDMGLGTGSKLGGYAYFTQEDPRPYAKTQLQSQQPWQLLFQMDTHDEDDGVWIMWGDCGVGNFFIDRKSVV